MKATPAAVANLLATWNQSCVTTWNLEPGTNLVSQRTVRSAMASISGSCWSFYRLPLFNSYLIWISQVRLIRLAQLATHPRHATSSTIFSSKRVCSDFRVCFDFWDKRDVFIYFCFKLQISLVFWFPHSEHPNKFICASATI